MPDSITGSRTSCPAAVMRKLIPITKKIGETVHSVMIPSSRFCHWAIKMNDLNRSGIPPR